MLFNISGGGLAFEGEYLFENLNIQFNEGEKKALIGRNGCGKSSLLRIVAGELELTDGKLFINKNRNIAYLHQDALDNKGTVKEQLLKPFTALLNEEAQLQKLAAIMEADNTALNIENYTQAHDLFMAHGGYDYENEIKFVFTGLGFNIDELEREVASFSGGEKTKIAFAQLLLSKPDLLLLDEPTNHLDLQAIEWLESYLQQYKKALLIVSHDRTFIDKTCQGIYELEYGQLTYYGGNYEFYLNKKQNDALLKQRAYHRQQKEIKRLEQLIEKFRYKDSKASFAQSKIKYLERMDKLDKPRKADEKVFKLHFDCRNRGGKEVLQLEDYCVGYEKELCKVNLQLERGERLCIMGPNGCGKSTLLKTLVGKIEALGGYALWGHQIESAYFEQNLSGYQSSKTLIEDFWDNNPQLTQQQLRDLLGAFNFSADEVFKECKVLSGGEKVRLELAKVMLKQANLLLLDEPTNHLDILAKEVLEEALQDYEGTIIFVSHDRYFIKKIATSILYIEAGKAIYYPDGYGDYLELRVNERVEQKQEKKEEYKKQLQQKNRYDLRKIEASINELEEELEYKRELRYEPEYYHDSKKMQQLDEEIDDIHNRLAKQLELWEEAMSYEEQKNK